MVGTGSPVSFRRRPPLASRGVPDCQSSATAFTPAWAHVSAWGPARHDNHEGQRMTPGAPTDGARSRFPGHRGSTEAGTALKDSGKRHHSSKGAHCGSSLIDEAGADDGDLVSFAGTAGTLVSIVGAPTAGHMYAHEQARRGARRRLPASPSPTGERYLVPPGDHAPSGHSRFGHSSAFSVPASSIKALGSTVITASAFRAR